MVRENFFIFSKGQIFDLFSDINENPNLTPKQEYDSREASRAAEKRLADRLRARGFKVYGGN
ncbi:MAG: hypothetical protein RLZZ553_973 [Verrucomicrobiota bacterium]|jgi:hypothetical protein